MGYRLTTVARAGVRAESPLESDYTRRAVVPSCRRCAPHSYASPVLLILFTRLLRLLDPILVDLHPWSKLAPALIHEAQRTR